MLKKLLSSLRGAPVRPDGQPVRVSHGAALKVRQSVEAMVIRACAECGAPGRYLSDEHIRDGWLGCWVPAADPRAGQAVGAVCPNCGSKRPQSENLGEIWVREFS